MRYSYAFPLCLRSMLRLSGDSVGVSLTLGAERAEAAARLHLENEVILSLNCRNVSCHGIFPFAVSPTDCFPVIIFLKQILMMVRISLPRPSDHLSDQLIEIMDFVSRLSVSFLLQIKTIYARLIAPLAMALNARNTLLGTIAPRSKDHHPHCGQKRQSLSSAMIPSRAPFVAPFVVHMGLMARF
jgi:hypothetical protein